MRLAIVGCGYVANMYRLSLPLHPELELVGVFDTDAERADGMAGLTGSQAYPSLDALLDDERVDLVLNLTNPKAHFDVSRRCLDAGKHVFTEKPVALDLEEAKQLVAIAAERGLMFSSAPCTLLSPAAQTLWKAVRDETVGKVRLVYAEMEDGMVHRMPVQKWVNEAGVPWPYADEFETGCTVEHAGYVLTWLCAFFGPAQRVTAFSSTLVNEKVPGETLDTAADFSVACVTFADGTVARMTNGVYAPHDHRLRVFGDDGVLTVDDPRSDRSPVRMQTYKTIRRKMFLNPWRKKLPLLGPKEKTPAYRGSQSRDFCRSIAEMAAAHRAGRPPKLDADFGLHVTELTLATQYAFRTGMPYELTTTFTPPTPMPWAG